MENNFGGLTSESIKKSREKYGHNTIKEIKQKSFLQKFIQNLGDPIIKILLVALVVNIAFNFRNINFIENGGIALAIFLSTFISTFSEHTSQKAFQKMNMLDTDTVIAMRNGKEIEILSSEIVVGDILILHTGEKVEADGILLDGSLTLDQSALTGESVEIEKTKLSKSYADFFKKGEEFDFVNPLFDDQTPSETHSVFKGSLVSSGEGKIIVTSVGDSTKLGKIFYEIQSDKRESPLKNKLYILAKEISVFGYIAGGLIALFSFFSAISLGFDRVRIIANLRDTSIIFPALFHSLTLGLTVILMAVPEGLPMMVAVILSSNIKKMQKANVLTRKPVGIESAGSMNILFTDKTGTLTKGKISLDKFILGNGDEYKNVEKLKENANYKYIKNNILYNTSSILLSSGQVFGGNITEKALLNLFKNENQTDIDLVKNKILFDSKIKYSSAELNGVTYYKGAPEVLLSKCEYYLDGEKNENLLDKIKIQSLISTEAQKGKRVIILSSKENEKTYLNAIVSLSDPPRREAKMSVETLNSASIQVVMVTGDSLPTAKKIATDVGIISKSRSLVLTHDDLTKLNDDELAKLIPSLSVVARALPEDKSRLVKIAENIGLVVGMTGDGINDAPALKLADVGFAMGSGTRVAKEAGDIIILDNNLSSIVNAVLFGRNIFKSIRKFLVFQLTVNFSSCILCMLAPIFKIDTPITVTQMLWVNMIMDTLGGLAFAGEAPEKRIMKEKPKKRSEKILNKYMLNQIIFLGGYSLLLSLLFLKLDFFAERFRESENNLVLMAGFFALYIFIGVFEAICSRSDRLNLLNGISKNKAFIFIMLLIFALQLIFIYFGGEVLRTTPLLLKELLFVIFCSFSVVPFDMLRRILYRLFGNTKGF